MVNRKAEAFGYYCPACHSVLVSPDDSFLRLMVSAEKQLADVRRMEVVLEENETLKAFKLFFQVPCELCGKPIEVWDEYNVKLVIDGTGFGHTSCLRTPSGQRTELLMVLQRHQQNGNGVVRR